MITINTYNIYSSILQLEGYANLYNKECIVERIMYVMYSALYRGCVRLSDMVLYLARAVVGSAPSSCLRLLFKLR